MIDRAAKIVHDDDPPRGVQVQYRIDAISGDARTDTIGVPSGAVVIPFLLGPMPRDVPRPSTTRAIINGGAGFDLGLLPIIVGVHAEHSLWQVTAQHRRHGSDDVWAPCTLVLESIVGGHRALWRPPIMSSSPSGFEVRWSALRLADSAVTYGTSSQAHNWRLGVPVLPLKAWAQARGGNLEIHWQHVGVDLQGFRLSHEQRIIHKEDVLNPWVRSVIISAAGLPAEGVLHIQSVNEIGESEKVPVTYRLPTSR